MPLLRVPERLETLAVHALTTFALCDMGDALIANLAFKPPSQLNRRQRRRHCQHSVDASVFESDDDDDEEVSDDADAYAEPVKPMRTRSDRLQRCVHIMRCYFSYNIPAPVHDTVCAALFDRFPSSIARIKKMGMSRASMSHYLQQVNVIVALTECVVSAQLRRLDFERMPKMLRHVFYANLSLLSGLRFLNLSSLSGGWKTADMEPTVLAGIVEMPHLQYFCLNHDCTDAILLQLAESCPQLHTLDVSSSKHVSNESVNLLYRFGALRVVQLYRTSVTMEGYVNLLLRLPHLHDIGRYDEIGRALDYIVQQYAHVPPFGLRRFSSRFVTSGFLQTLAEHCPDLRHVSVFHNALICDLMLLCGCNELTELQLLSCDFFGDRVRDVLHVKGCNLTQLHLEHVDQIDMNALMYISQYCVDLHDLTFYNCEMVASTSLSIKRPGVPPFMNLRRLTMVALCDEQHVEFLLGGCLHVEYVRLGAMVPTTDSLFERVLAKNPMAWLSELRITESEELSVATAYRLVEVCPALQAMSEVTGWKGSSPEEWEAFRVFVRVNNMAVCLDTKMFAN